MSHKVMVETDLLADILAKSLDPWPNTALPERRALIRDMFKVVRPDGPIVGARIRHLQFLDRHHTRYKNQEADAPRSPWSLLGATMDWDELDAWFEANDQTS
jgi:hypothetical protein